MELFVIILVQIAVSPWKYLQFSPVMHWKSNNFSNHNSLRRKHRCLHQGHKILVKAKGWRLQNTKRETERPKQEEQPNEGQNRSHDRRRRRPSNLFKSRKIHRKRKSLNARSALSESVPRCSWCAKYSLHNSKFDYHPRCKFLTSSVIVPVQCSRVYTGGLPTITLPSSATSKTPLPWGRVSPTKLIGVKSQIISS